MTLLLTVLGAMLCSLMVSCQVQPQADFDLQKVAGKWYLLGVATNAKWMDGLRNNMKSVTVMMTSTSDGSLQMLYSVRNPDGACWKMTKVASKTDVPGKFMFLKGDWVVDYHIIAAKYDEYIVVNVTKTKKNGTVEIITKIYGRATDLSDESKEKFKEFALDKGNLPENIVFATYTAGCPEV